MKKFDNYIIEKPWQFSLRINNSVGEIFLLQPF
ncbi:competence damage-inducible protein A [Streptococcus pneumoniae]|nr:competence damage-inducible protein A [Streptococcus pneumoniae]VIX46862.1 competence damage-inducible protein A [Streptococcus pneumoniae]